MVQGQEIKKTHLAGLEEQKNTEELKLILCNPPSIIWWSTPKKGFQMVHNDIIYALIYIYIYKPPLYMYK